MEDILKRSYEDAFEHRFLNKIKINYFYVKTDMFRVYGKNIANRYKIKTTDNNDFKYDDAVITKRSKSATEFDREEVFTKTELIELFAKISVNDVWSAMYKTYDKTNEWPNDIVEIIKGLTTVKASEYVKRNFMTFGKADRTIIGHKINHDSNNNYYMVRDLQIHFDLLDKGVNVKAAYRQSIRSLDVNTIQYLIFNGVKYILKSK